MGRVAGVGTRLTPPGAGGYVYNTTIDESVVNSEFNDLYAEMTNSIACDGSSTITANIPMGGYTLTGMADATANTSPASLGQVYGKNYIGNSSFLISSGSTGPFTTSGDEVAPCVELDNYIIDVCAVNKTAFTVGQTDVPFYPYAYLSVYKQTCNSATASFTHIFFKMEDVAKFAPVAHYFSVWAKADSACSFTVEGIQNFGSGGSATVENISTLKQAVTTSWVKYKFPITPASITGKTVAAGSYFGVRLWTSAGTNYDVQTDTLGTQQGRTLYFACPKFERGTWYTRWECPRRDEENTFVDRYRQVIWYSVGARVADTESVLGSTVFGTEMWTTPTITKSDETLVNCASPTLTAKSTGFLIDAVNNAGATAQVEATGKATCIAWL